jgi:phosphatidylinositol N-acetylglucosaminyltransferase subunit Y
MKGRAAKQTIITEAAAQSISDKAAAADDRSTFIWGVALVAISFGWFFITIFAIVGTKLLPSGPTGVPVLDYLRNDWYYSLLVPLTIPVALVAIYLNWLGMKLFRHS